MNVLLTTLAVGAAAAGGAAIAVQQWRRERFARVLEHGGHVQLAADGRLALTAVQQRDSEFDVAVFLERAAEFQERFYAAWTARDMTSVRGVMLPGMRDRLYFELDMHRTLLRKPEVYDIAVSAAEVVEAVHDGICDIVYVRLTGDAMRRTMHVGNNRWLGGGVAPEPFAEIWGFVRGASVVSRTGPGTLEGFCAGCGADLVAAPDATRCPACDTVLDDGSKDWAVGFLGRADGWRPSDVPPPEAERPENALSRILDTVAGLFWRVRSATLHADESVLQGVATREFITAHLAEFRPMRDGRHAFHAMASLERLEWVGFSEGRAWMRVHWCGISSQARVPAFVQEETYKLSPCVDDYVLEWSDREHRWMLADIFRVLGDVPCSDLLDELEETRRLERLPLATRWEREGLVQVCVLLLLRQGALAGRRLSRVAAAAELFDVDQERLPILIRQVETEGAVMFGRECKLPPETLFRHLARVALSCGAMRPAVLKLLRDVAQALGVESVWKTVLQTEQRLLMDVVARIERAGRRR